MKERKGLGKGFDALIPTEFDKELILENNERIQKLFIDKITPNPHQPRRTFDQEALEELANSIKHYGVLQPIIVSPDTGHGYMLVAGERRLRASQLAGLKDIPAIVRKRKELERLEVALIENVQRVDLSPIEQAISIERLHQQFNMPYSDIAQRLGKAVSTVNNIVRLLKLPHSAREALASGKISEGHARAILAVKDASQQEELLRLIITKNWTVRQAEQFAVSLKQGVEAKQAKKTNVIETPDTKKLGKYLNTKVTVRRTAKGGRLEIHYKTENELADFIGRFAKT